MTRDDSLPHAASGGASERSRDLPPISSAGGQCTTGAISTTSDAVPSDLARLEFIFEAAPVGLSYTFTDANGRKTRVVNERLLEMSGLTRGEADELVNFTRATHPEDRLRQAGIVARLERGEIDRYSLDKRYVRPDGSVFWVMLSSHRRRHPDGSYEDVSVIVDLTDRKNAESELERFFSVALDFLTIAGGDGYFKRVNPTVTDILGWSVEEFLATPYLELVHPDDREATRREAERQLATGVKVLQFENRYRHKNGSWRILSWRSVPHANGLMYGAARDVTESRHAEAEIKRLNEGLQVRATQIEAVNKELEAFSYSVSHDLRAPLRHIQGYVGMLEREMEGQLSEKAKRYLDTITKAAREMGQLIDELLLFSRMGRAEICEIELDLNAMVSAVRAGLEVATKDRSIEWRIGSLPSVRGDRGMLKQVFTNLLDNAIKYTRPRAPAIIEVGCTGEEGDRAILYVRDNGVGFDLKYADKLFGVFQRLHRADEFEGTGVGLANVHRIVLRHGGRAWADAKLDGGATFYFTLPRAASAASHAEKTP
jgi:PAS domain S-box-containing protein